MSWRHQHLQNGHDLSWGRGARIVTHRGPPPAAGKAPTGGTPRPQSAGAPAGRCVEVGYRGHRPYQWCIDVGYRRPSAIPAVCRCPGRRASAIPAVRRRRVSAAIGRTSRASNVRVGGHRPYQRRSVGGGTAGRVGAYLDGLAPVGVFRRAPASVRSGRGPVVLISAPHHRSAGGDARPGSAAA